MQVDKCYELGYIVKTHGLKGDVVVILDVDNPHDYKKLKEVFISLNNVLTPFAIERIKIQDDKTWIKFKDINRIEDAEPLVKNKLYLPLDILPELDDKNFYFHEIINFSIIDQQKGELGKIAEVYQLPHQDVIAMKYKNKEVLIPINDQTIGKVDRENKQLFVNLPEGLLEVYLES